MTELWQRVLGISRVGLEDDFFELGGHSLSAALMLTELDKELNTRREVLDETDFLEEPTVASLARNC